MSKVVANVKTAVFLAFKDLSKDRAIAVLVVFVVALGFLFFGLSTALGGGFEDAVQNELITTLTSHLVIEPLEIKEPFDQSTVSNIERKLDQMPGIAGVSPRLKREASISKDDKTTNTLVLAFTPSKDSEVTELSEMIEYGEFLDDDDVGEIVLGIQLVNVPAEGTFSLSTLLNKVDAEVGDIVTVTYRDGVTRDYRVKGIMKAGSLGADWWGYVTNKEMESVIGEQKASEILVRLDDGDLTDKYQILISQQGIRANVRTWKGDMNFIRSVTDSLGMFTQLITAIGLVTTMITIWIVIYINTSRKKSLIGVLKAIGARNYTILIVFILEAAIFSIFGIMIGIGMSYMADAYVSQHPMPMPIGDVYLSFTPSLFIEATVYMMIASILAGLYPAMKASRQDVVKSLWEE
ncbi:MAG: FtsX-like permease family protein [Halobacteriota archaeon]|nr:FtsX-like permease family protein [Halobacteriota archaeon]